jgi:hypothetical protein
MDFVTCYVGQINKHDCQHEILARLLPWPGKSYCIPVTIQGNLPSCSNKDYIHCHSGLDCEGECNLTGEVIIALEWSSWQPPQIEYVDLFRFSMKNIKRKGKISFFTCFLWQMYECNISCTLSLSYGLQLNLAVSVSVSIVWWSCPMNWYRFYHRVRHLHRQRDQSDRSGRQAHWPRKKTNSLLHLNSIIFFRKIQKMHYPP